VALRVPLALQAPGRLPGEGRFHAAVTRRGQPVLQVAHLRADGTHGSIQAGVVWVDQKATRFELHPGWADPGHLALWNQPDWVPPSERSTLLATFNGGFKTPELRGGFYENGHTAGKLLAGLASLVIHRDGRVSLGSWADEERLSGDVVAVRQNLHLLIDQHRIRSGLDSNVTADWGPMIGVGPAVWRSGVGITARGDFVLVMGSALTPQTLANLLLDAGSVRGMEMDINPAWMSFMWYTHPAGATPRPHKLITFQRSADRYFTHTSRDFFALHLR